MSMLGIDVLHGFSKFIGDYWVGETTATGTTTTMVDNKLGRFGDDSIVDFYLRPIQDTNIYEVRRLDSFISSRFTRSMSYIGTTLLLNTNVLTKLGIELLTICLRLCMTIHLLVMDTVRVLIYLLQLGKALSGSLKKALWTLIQVGISFLLLILML